MQDTAAIESVNAECETRSRKPHNGCVNPVQSCNAQGADVRSIPGMRNITTGHNPHLHGQRYQISATQT